MGDHLKETGKALVMDPERQKEPSEWVQRLLQVRRWVARGPQAARGLGLGRAGGQAAGPEHHRSLWSGQSGLPCASVSWPCHDVSPRVHLCRRRRSTTS